MNKLFFTVLLLNGLVLSQFSQAEETLSLTVMDQNFNSSDRIIIDQDAIKRSRATNVAQVLSSQANITITTSNFQPNSVFVRGGDSSHVLFVIDDVPTYDASTLQKTVNLSNLNVTNIKRIEILKGSQSVIYGGQALSAVIKIYTIPDAFKNTGKALLGVVPGRGAGISAGFEQMISDNALVSLQTNYKDMQNLSPVLNSNKEYPQKAVITDFAMIYNLNQKNQAILKLNATDDKNQIPTTSNAPPDYKAVDTNEFKFRTRNQGATLILRNPEIYNISLSRQNNKRNLFQEAADSIDGSQTILDDVGDLDNARVELFVPKNDTYSGVLGLTYAAEKFDENDGTTLTEGSTQYEGAFLKLGYNIIPDAILVEAGVRNEFSKLKSLATSYQLGLTFFKELKLEYSTGFKSPSLAQLYSPMYGNPDLKAETAETVNLLYDKKWTDRFSTSLSVFDSNYKNLLMYVGNFPTGKYQNVASTRTTGSELVVNFADENGGLNYQVFFAYQEPYDATTGTWLVKRPLQSAGTKITKFFPSEQTSMTFELSHIGERRDKRTSTKFIQVADYTVVNFSGNLKLTQNTETFARFENLTSQTYQTSYGYYESGVRGALGFQIGY